MAISEDIFDGVSLKTLFLILCTRVWVHLCVSHVCRSPQMSEVSVRFPLELELQVFVNPGTGAEKQIPVLCKSSKYS